MKLDRKTLRALGLASGVGFSIVGSIALWVFIGRWLDMRLGTEPLALVAGIIVGLISAGSIIYELAATRERTDDQGQQDMDRNADG
jgi:F0F1-type ATP synthase assembly protein I